MDDRQVSDADVRLIEREEGLVSEVQYLVQELMNERGVNRAELADLLGISKSRVTQLLGDNANPTLRTLVGVFDAMGEEIVVSRASQRKQTKVASCDPRSEKQDWQADKKSTLVPADAMAHASPSIWQALLELETTSWRVDPVSNDNWGVSGFEEVAACG